MLKTLPDATGKKVESTWADADVTPPFSFTVQASKDGIKVTKVAAPVKDFS